jgi:hypothetical protein
LNELVYVISSKKVLMRKEVQGNAIHRQRGALLNYRLTTRAKYYCTCAHIILIHILKKEVKYCSYFPTTLVYLNTAH